MRIVIVGAGVVGTATGKGFARRGHAVMFVDTDARRVDALRREGAAASSELDLRGQAATVMLSVPTPSSSAGYDLSAVRNAAAAVGEALRSAEELSTVVLRSTVAPGTLEGTVQPIIEQRSGQRAGEGFALASNPEFLRAELYRPFGGTLELFADPAEAEFVKLVHNVFNATKISFFNEVWSLASHLGLDAHRIAATVASSAEASWNPGYGIRGGRPYGGACLPKDVSGFLGFALELGLDAPMAAATRAVNERLIREADQPTIDLRSPVEPDPGPAGVPRR